eukprot:TRINITY_DN7854_c0_g1_i1.p1 TRINITY_DN7854_c0_g1~~TRINITY_DN7854_c0_g1_i1.p1  ORF type:complete len:946 (-),score=229.17 TRINITY_DN7854_c0_g1_i1:200-3037(-)
MNSSLFSSPSSSFHSTHPFISTPNSPKEKNDNVGNNFNNGNYSNKSKNQPIQIRFSYRSSSFPSSFLSFNSLSEEDEEEMGSFDENFPFPPFTMRCSSDNPIQQSTSTSSSKLDVPLSFKAASNSSRFSANDTSSSSIPSSIPGSIKISPIISTKDEEGEEFSSNVEKDDLVEYLTVPPSTPSSFFAISPSSNYSASSYSSSSSFREFYSYMESSSPFSSSFHRNESFRKELVCETTDEEDEGDFLSSSIIIKGEESENEDSFDCPFNYEEEIKNSIDLFEEEEQFTGLKRSTNMMQIKPIPSSSIDTLSPSSIELGENGLTNASFHPENQIDPLSEMFCQLYREKKPMLSSILSQQFNCRANNINSFPSFMRDLFNLGLFDNVTFLSKSKLNINAREYIKSFLEDKTDFSLLRDTMNLALFHAVQSLVNKGITEKKEKHFLETVSQILKREIDPHNYREEDKNMIQTKILNENAKFPSFQYSRFQQEFILLENLGKGGFGHVIKVMNKLDGIQYALKLIRFNTGNEVKTQQVMREVKALSQLDHPNVCRFYNAWFERTDNLYLQECLGNARVFDDTSAENSERSDSYPLEHSNNSSIIFENSMIENSGITIDSLDGSHIVEWSTNNSTNETKEPSTFGNQTGSIIFESDTGDFLTKNGTKSPNSGQMIQFHGENKQILARKIASIKARPFILFIQMQYYRHNTLKNWLEHRNKNTKFTSNQACIKPQANWKIFRQITEGLRYIHSKGIIHRDIKPDNIFISEDGVFKIGDFGLAKVSENEELRKNIERISSLVTARERAKVEHTGGVGTPSYAGPEQLLGNSYDSRSDVYSLGIILFELFYVFGTHSERTKVLSQLRKNVVPASFQEDFPEECQLVIQLMSQDPLLRPSASDVLNHPLLNQEQVQIAKLGKQLNESQTLLEQQRLRMSELEQKLRELQEQSSSK